jgi:hypothetical protein
MVLAASIQAPGAVREALLVYAARAAAHAAAAQEAAARTAAKASQSASPWYAVGAGLVAALIVAAGALWSARRQRKADDRRFGDQLDHDRRMRAEDRAYDRSVRAEERLHDRRMRDLEHLRTLLETCVTHASDTTLDVVLVRAVLPVEPDTPVSDTDLKRMVNDHTKHLTVIHYDMLKLIVAVGKDSVLVERLKAVIEAGQEFEKVIERVGAGEEADPLAAITAASTDCVDRVTSLIHAANDYAGTNLDPAMATGAITGVSTPEPAA